jgi:hydroxyacylglutathione hydrolase
LVQGNERIQFVDVRRLAEHAACHAAGTVNMPLNKLGSGLKDLDPGVPTYVICQTGYRSSVGASILENAGFSTVFNVAGGTTAWQQAGLETEVDEAECAATSAAGLPIGTK